MYNVFGLVASEGYTTCMYNIIGLVASEGHTTCMYNVLDLVAREGYTSCVYIVYTGGGCMYRVNHCSFHIVSWIERIQFAFYMRCTG